MFILSYFEKNKNLYEVVAVVENKIGRRNKFQEIFNLPQNRVFENLDDFFKATISDLTVTSKHHECGVDSYVNARIEFNDQIGIVECAMDRKKENRAVFTGSSVK